MSWNVARVVHEAAGPAELASRRTLVLPLGTNVPLQHSSGCLGVTSSEYSRGLVDPYFLKPYIVCSVFNEPSTVTVTVSTTTRSHADTGTGRRAACNYSNPILSGA